MKTLQRSPSFLFPGLMIALGLLIICFFINIALGVADISLPQIYQAVFSFNGSTEHLIIRTVRIPRSLVALSVGAALAISGTLMQGITQNPLASPSILGINAGASFLVVLATSIIGNNSLNVYAIFAFLGAGITATIVYGIAALGKGGITPLNLTLAGAALTAFMGSLTSGILIINQSALSEIRFWLAGSVGGKNIELLSQIFPYLLIGLLLAFALGKHITILSFGDDMALGLGQETAWIKVMAAISIILLAGGSVALAGPIGFIGLIIPHIVRFLVGIDYRWILPYSAILGAILLLITDTIARLILQPQEIPVGLIMPLIGSPFLIYLIRKKVKSV
ncbi:FecCD family ABC transporter permease [Crocosphaera chwakensis]|uniref:Iron(III) dicitrate transport system permease protein FecC n=1 Tax=Crocosphaera chwakensis CCY0110 TaxID=391612 RepID=A3ISC6_9CHRO|nr:iron ABC transporter permease [Crocosphaera chwakensis]EAZ90642.1 iron(III) dicitrate transport system permease protein; FecC [Crocosphaera chwakensis CCY0110]